MQIQIDIPEAELDSAVTAYNEGRTLSQVVGAVPAFRAAMVELLVARGVQIRRRKTASKRMPDAEFAAIQERLKRGDSWSEIAASSKATASTLERRYLRRLAEDAQLPV